MARQRPLSPQRSLQAAAGDKGDVHGDGRGRPPHRKLGDGGGDADPSATTVAMAEVAMAVMMGGDGGEEDEEDSDADDGEC